jgi:hypothetical protein
VPEPVHLTDLALEPVIELEPGRFAQRERLFPAQAGEEAPDEWDRYWLASLADSGVVGVQPLRPGSWRVRTRELTDSIILERIARVLLSAWEQIDDLVAPDSDPVLSGGFALMAGGRLMLEPTCCGDLRGLDDWQEASEYRGSDWNMVWIGHPWVSTRFDGDKLLISALHESEPPVARYSLDPNCLANAVIVARGEAERFSRRLETAVEPIFGRDLAPRMSRQLSGLPRADG